MEDKIIRQLDKIFFKFALICFVTSSQSNKNSEQYCYFSTFILENKKG